DLLDTPDVYCVLGPKELMPGTLTPHRRVIGAIAIAAPHIKRSARRQYPRDVAEPSVQKPVEVRFGKVVISQRSVLGPELPCRRLGFVRIAHQIESLMVRH